MKLENHTETMATELKKKFFSMVVPCFSLKIVTSKVGNWRRPHCWPACKISSTLKEFFRIIERARAGSIRPISSCMKSEWLFDRFAETCSKIMCQIFFVKFAFCTFHWKIIIREKKLSCEDPSIHRYKRKSKQWRQITKERLSPLLEKLCSSQQNALSQIWNRRNRMCRETFPQTEWMLTFCS